MYLSGFLILRSDFGVGVVYFGATLLDSSDVLKYAFHNNNKNSNVEIKKKLIESDKPEIHCNHCCGFCCYFWYKQRSNMIYALMLSVLKFICVFMSFAFVIAGWMSLKNIAVSLNPVSIRNFSV